MILFRHFLAFFFIFEAVLSSVQSATFYHDLDDKEIFPDSYLVSNLYNVLPGYYSTSEDCNGIYTHDESPSPQLEIIKTLNTVSHEVLARTITTDIQSFLLHKGIGFDDQLPEILFRIILRAKKLRFIHNSKIVFAISTQEILIGSIYFELAIKKMIAKHPADLSYFNSLEEASKKILEIFTGAFITSLKICNDNTPLYTSDWRYIPDTMSSYWQKILTADEFRRLRTTNDKNVMKAIISNCLFSIEQKFHNLIDFELYINPERDFLPLAQHILDSIIPHNPLIESYDSPMPADSQPQQKSRKEISEPNLRSPTFHQSRLAPLPRSVAVENLAEYQSPQAAPRKVTQSAPLPEIPQQRLVRKLAPGSEQKIVSVGKQSSIPALPQLGSRQCITGQIF